jgi:hypothetical protein
LPLSNGAAATHRRMQHWEQKHDAAVIGAELALAYERGKAEQCAAAERQGVIKGLREAKAMTENAYKDSKAYKGAVTAKMFRQIVVAIRFRADELEKQKP